MIIYRKSLIKIFVLVFFSISLSASIWLYFAEKHQDLVINILESLEDENIKISHKKIKIIGYPFALNTNISGLSIILKESFVGKNKLISLDVNDDIEIKQNFFSKNIVLNFAPKEAYNLKSHNKTAKLVIRNNDSFVVHNLNLNKFVISFKFLDSNFFRFNYNSKSFDYDKIDNLIFSFQNAKLVDESGNENLSIKNFKFSILKDNDQYDSNYLGNLKISNFELSEKFLSFKENILDQIKNQDKPKNLFETLTRFFLERSISNIKSNFVFSFDIKNLYKMLNVKNFDLIYDSNLEKIFINGDLNFHKEIDETNINANLTTNINLKEDWYHYYQKTPKTFFKDFLKNYSKHQFTENEINNLFPVSNKYSQFEIITNFKIAKHANDIRSTINEVSFKSNKYKISFENAKIFFIEKLFVIGDLNINGVKYLIKKISNYLNNNQELIEKYFLKENQYLDLTNSKNDLFNLLMMINNEKRIIDDNLVVLIHNRDDKIFLRDLYYQNYLDQITNNFVKNKPQ